MVTERLAGWIRWGDALHAPGEDAAISRDSLPLASRGFRVVERVRDPCHRLAGADPCIYRGSAENQQQGGDQPDKTAKLEAA